MLDLEAKVRLVEEFVVVCHYDFFLFRDPSEELLVALGELLDENLCRSAAGYLRGLSLGVFSCDAPVSHAHRTLTANRMNGKLLKVSGGGKLRRWPLGGCGGRLSILGLRLRLADDVNDDRLAGVSYGSCKFEHTIWGHVVCKAEALPLVPWVVGDVEVAAVVDYAWGDGVVTLRSGDVLERGQGEAGIEVLRGQDWNVGRLKGPDEIRGFGSTWLTCTVGQCKGQLVEVGHGSIIGEKAEGCCTTVTVRHGLERVLVLLSNELKSLFAGERELQGPVVVTKAWVDEREAKRSGARQGLERVQEVAGGASVTD